MDWRAEAIVALRGIKRVPLGHLPTPVESLDRLSTLLQEFRIWVKRDDCTGLAESANAGFLLNAISSELIAQGQRPYLIPLGGSNGLGALAYATAFLEALEQFRTLQEPLDAIVVPSGSGGTLAGLLLGAILSEWPGKIIGISVSDKNERAIQKVRRPQLEAAKVLGIPIQAVNQTSVLMDAGLLALVEEKYFDENMKNLLFWHTGGGVALHGYPEILDRPQI
jgi:1-aminocyclopropane-1-carboxylate deaminase/D-cysteine desulfhydrase-like pyridoxal-dependent ACC family enzyme